VLSAFDTPLPGWNTREARELEVSPATILSTPVSNGSPSGVPIRDWQAPVPYPPAEVGGKKDSCHIQLK